MKSSLHHGLILAGALLASGLCPEPRAGSSGSFIAVAQADDTIVMSRCTIKGSAPTNKGQQLFDSAKDGRVIGQFSGAIGPLSATLPMELGGRAKVSTSAGKPTVRLDGWLPTSALTIFAAKDIPVLQGNLWLATGYQVKPSKVTSDQLTSELTIQGTQDRKIRGTAPCDSYSLNQVRPVPYDIPGNARGYLTKGNSITLFDNPNGTEILELAMEDGASQLFWSTESRGGFVHVLNRGDIVVDAWIRFRELSALKKGEMMDQHIPPSSRIAGVQLKLEKEPRLHTASKNIPIRVRPDDKAPTIGVIESGAEFLEVGTTAKWLNILPKDLYITPPTDGGFWVPADAVAAKLHSRKREPGARFQPPLNVGFGREALARIVWASKEDALHWKVMRTRDLFFLPLALASVFLGPSLLRAPGAGLVAEAHAQDALSACSLKGSPQLARGLQLFDSPKDGKVIAEFIGGAVPLSLTVPEDPENSRAKVSTSAGKPTLRLEGWLSMESIPVYTVKDVEVVGDHVKISAGYRVKLTKGAKTRLSAEVTIAGSQSQVLKGTGGCNAFSLAWAAPNPPEPPEKARHYLMKGTSLDLFDKPNGENIYSLNMSDGASPLFHSIENRGMYMHVMSRSDVAIDAWVKLGTLTPIKKGDRIESPPSAPASGPGSRMVLDSPPPLKTASKDILVRPSREDTAKAAGVLEKGAEFYVTQVVSGWANILPKELNISPPSSGGFWVKSDDLP